MAHEHKTVERENPIIRTIEEEEGRALQEIDRAQKEAQQMIERARVEAEYAIERAYEEADQIAEIQRLQRLRDIRIEVERILKEGEERAKKIEQRGLQNVKRGVEVLYQLVVGGHGPEEER